MATHCIWSKLSQNSGVLCLEKRHQHSSLESRAANTFKTYIEKDTYIPSLYDFGLAQTLSCTNQTWGEYFGKVLPFSRMYGMMYSHDKMMVNTKPLGPTISG